MDWDECMHLLPVHVDMNGLEILYLFLGLGGREGLNYKGPGTVEYLKNPAPSYHRVIYLRASHSSDLEIKNEARNNH